MRSGLIRQFLAIAVFCLSGAFIYWNTLHAPFYFDDRAHILHNLNIRDPLALGAIWNFWATRFLTFFSFAVNYRFNHFDVIGYHLVNLGLHIASALIIWRLIRVTFLTPVLQNADISRHRCGISFFTALIFLVHPLQTEAVTYIYQRATCLAAFFYLGALLFYAKARLSSSPLFYLISLAMGVAGMLSKETAATLPLAVLLYEYSFLHSQVRAGWKYSLLFFAAALVIPVGLFFFNPETFQDIRRITEIPAAVYIRYPLTQPRVIMTYIRLLFLPYNQNLDYDYRFSSSLWEWDVLASLAGIVVILVMGRRLFARHRLAAFGIFWFFLTLLPESSFIPIRDLIFEHRLYLPLFGFAVFLASGVFSLFNGKKPRLAVILLIGAAIVYSVLAFNRNTVWSDEVVLCSDTVRKSPGKARPYGSRGLAYARRGMNKEALADFNRCLEIDPGYAEFYVSRGIIYAGERLDSRALADFNRCLEIDQRNAYAYYIRGDFYYRQGLYALALADFNRCLELAPGWGEVYSKRGAIYSLQGNYSEAVADFKRAIALDPGASRAYNGLGIVYARQGHYPEATGEFTRAIKADSGYADAYVNRGNARDSQGMYREAIADFTRALELDPKLSDACNSRGVTYLRQGMYREAIADFTRALELDPGYAVAYFNLGLAYRSLKEYGKSRDNLGKARELFRKDQNYQAVQKIEEVFKTIPE